MTDSLRNCQVSRVAPIFPASYNCGKSSQEFFKALFHWELLMRPTVQVPRKKYQYVAGFLAFFYFLPGAFVTEAAPVTVFGLENKQPPGLQGELYQFNESGPLEQRWEISETRFGLSMATDGTSLYVAEFGRAINRYDLNGVFLGQFADVSSMAGSSPNSPKLETDSAGSVYTTFGGQASQPRTSFRFDQDGNISETFLHVDLVFPRGIDAAANGDVYILNSAAVGVGHRLFKFGSTGTYIDDFSIPKTNNPSDIAINELSEELYIADEFGRSIHVYDISSGEPIFSSTLPVPERTSDVFIEPISGRIFGTYYTIGRENPSNFPHFTGFEISRKGSLLNLYTVDPAPLAQGIRSIVAVFVPEPASVLLVFVSVGFCLLSRPRKPFSPSQ